MALVKNFFAGIGCLTLLVVVGVVGWLYRGEIQEWLTRGDAIVMGEPSPELAERAEQKLDEVAQRTGSGPVTLTEMELQSYVLYRLSNRLPAGVSNPAVDLLDSTVALSASLDLRQLELDPNAAEGIRRLIGDSATIMTELLPSVAGPGEARVRVISLQAGVIPVPPLLIGRVLDQVGLPHDGSGSVRFDVDPAIREIRIADEQVVLERDR